MQNAVATVILATCPALPDETRDASLAAALQRIGIATHSVSLLMPDELHCDAELLAGRFIEIAQRFRGQLVGYAGSSAGAAGALVAAAQRPDLVSAVVSIDGRTDLASDWLHAVRAPTLLVVKDMPVLRMNREALAKLRCERRIEVIHESGIDTVVQKSAQWLGDKLALVPADAYGMV